MSSLMSSRHRTLSSSSSSSMSIMMMIPLLCCWMLTTCCLTTTTAFTVTTAPRVVPLRSSSARTTTTTTTTTTSLFADKTATNNNNQQSSSSSSYACPTYDPSIEFACQELRAILEELVYSKISYKTLTPDKRRTVMQCTQTLATKGNKYNNKRSEHPSTTAIIPPSSTWKLAFSTHDLPGLGVLLAADTAANLQVDFVDDSTLTYSLLFGNKGGLERLAVTCQYEWREQQQQQKEANSNNNKILVYTYQTITMDAFGDMLKQVPMEWLTLNQLQGRVNQIVTKYMDDTVWVEEGVDEASGETSYTVYLKYIKEYASS